MDLSNVSYTELHDELARRKQPKTVKPTANENPNFQKLIELCKNYVNDIESGKTGEDSDYDGYIYESALEAVFGDDVWVWLKDRIR